MRQTDDFEDKSGGLPIIYMALGVSLFILAVLGIVIAMNKKPSHRNRPVSDIAAETVDREENDSYVTTDKRTADQLDIWDMYPTDEEESDEEEESSLEEESTTEEKEDGNHFLLQYADGTEEWIKINPRWEKNTYDVTNIISSDGRLKYYSDGKKVSFLGVDISRYQKEVDFERLKADGIDFVMIRLGARGYKSGELQLDECFAENIKNASQAGLDIGVYFYSQAVTSQEALEEAALVLDNIKEYTIKYPIAFDMEFVDNDNARVETLTNEERTTLAATFLNQIKAAGYTPMLYGTPEWLLKRIDVSKFTESCIWLSEEADLPTYPYRYEMWQYTTKGQVDGIDGFVDLNISFVDYSAR